MRARSSEGLLYLLAGATIFALTEWLPIAVTAYTSFQRFDLIRPGTWVGLANYRTLLADRVLPIALANVAGLIFIRVLVILCVWKILEHAWSRGQRIPALFVLIAVAPLPFMTSVGTSIVWRALGEADAGLFRDLVAWASPDRARLSLYLVDALQTLAVAAALGLLVYALAQRAERSTVGGHPDVSALIALADRRYEVERRPAALALSATRGIALSIAAASGLQSFDLSYTLTRGGPASATTTPALLLFQIEFQRFRFGAGAALAVLLILLLLIPAWYMWLAMRRFNLRLVPLPAPNRHASSTATGASALVLLSLVPGIIILAPLVEVLVTSEPLVRFGLLRNFPWFEWWRNSLVPSGLAIWLIQIPVALAAAVGLVVVFISKPQLGQILLLPFLAASVIGPEVIGGGVFAGLYRLRVLGTQWASTVPLWSNGLAVLVFVLCLAGARSRLERAVLSGESLFGVLSKGILPSMRPAILLVGVFNMYWASQSIYWQLISTTSENQFTAAIGLLQIVVRGTYRPAEALLVLLPVAAIFAAGLVVCTYLLITRLELESA